MEGLEGQEGLEGLRAEKDGAQGFRLRSPAKSASFGETRQSTEGAMEVSPARQPPAFRVAPP